MIKLGVAKKVNIKKNMNYHDLDPATYGNTEGRLRGGGATQKNKRPTPIIDCQSRFRNPEFVQGKVKPPERQRQ